MTGLVVALLSMTPVLGEWEPVLMDVSAYCPCSLCCGPDAHGITASGVPAAGRVIAAPSSYRFGTEMRVPGYGVARVQDRGGAIKSAGEWVKNVHVGDQKVPDVRLTRDRIDLLFPTHDEALKWGRQTVTVWVKR
jgi:3D (Asp-Asp-Asp) domain-containing protein